MKTGNRYFDCFATLGPRQKMDPGEQYTREHVLESMDRCGIDCALVAATLAVRYDSMWANQWLLEQVAPYRKRLFPMWTALPHQMGEFPSPDKFVAMANTAGVRAVRLYPRTQCYSTAPSTLGPLMTTDVRFILPPVCCTEVSPAPPVPDVNVPGATGSNEETIVMMEINPSSRPMCFIVPLFPFGTLMTWPTPIGRLGLWLLILQARSGGKGSRRM